MSLLRAGVREYFRLRARTRERIAAEVDEEIDLHIELRARDLIAGGMDPEVARAEAERRFGGLVRARLKLHYRAQERERRMTLREWLAGWRQDVRYSARALGREPMVTLVIVLTLALGIGANATMFGIVDRLLLRGPAHVTAPEQVRRVYVTQKSWDGVMGTSSRTGYITYTLLRARRDLFEGVATYRRGDARIGSGENAVNVSAGWSTSDLFSLLGVKPALGRFFTSAEDWPNEAERVAIVDHAYWQSQYGGAASVLGQTLSIDDESYTIIGVAPAGFTGAELATVSVWLPLGTGYKPHAEWATSYCCSWLHVIARLAPGASWERANAEATRLYRTTAPPDRKTAADAALAMLPLGYGPTGEESNEVAVSRWLVGVSVIVLLVACANVMNLLLARAVRRRREVAVRLALGISRARLARLLFSESLLLAALGGLCAIALAYWGGHFLRLTLLPDVQWGSPVDTRVLAFSLVVVIATGIVIGLAPVLHARAHELTETLKATSRQTGTARGRLRGSLTVLQAAFSVVLLIGAGLFLRSLWRAQHMDLGIEADRVLAVWPNLGSYTGAAAGRQRAFLVAAVDELRARADVENAALAVGTPLQGAMSVDVYVPGRDSLPTVPGGGPFITAVSPGYFETVGTRILRGRGIQAGEGKGTEPVVVMGETMARALWPGADPLTKCIIIAEQNAACARVVGVAEDTKRFRLRDEPAMQYYVPLGQEQGVGGTQILVRPRSKPTNFIPELRGMLHALEPRAVYFNIDLLQNTLNPQIRPWRLGATMFMVFGGLALLIAAIGLYSVIAYSVAQRRVELGVRMALGARAASIVSMVLRQGLAFALAGIALGAVSALASGRFIEALLFETSASDGGIYAAVIATLIAVAILSAVIPALRAGRTNPVDALRTD